MKNVRKAVTPTERPHLQLPLRPLLLLAALLFPGASLWAAVPASPIVELRFNEGSGETSANAGMYGGTATLATYTTNTLPYFTNAVPTGTYAPAGNTSSIDMGLIFGSSTTGSGGRAIDLLTTNVNPANVEGTLGTEFPGLTVCGWLNARTLQAGGGGNRIAECFESAGVNVLRSLLVAGVGELRKTANVRKEDGDFTPHPSQ